MKNKKNLQSKSVCEVCKTEKNKYWVYKINKTWVEMDEVCLACLKKEREKNGKKL
tara:strand:- start:3751 stop:3915 length:165 start_codon:yes stop_codon:yes gene_type:complete